jgi:outer membrane protein assembly factor BamB
MIRSLWPLPRLSVLVFVLLLSGAGPARAQPQSPYPPLPEAVTSFGAAVASDTLYIVGGHIGKAHDHSAANLTGAVQSIPLRSRAAKWNEPIDSTPLQGLAVVEFGGKVYRIGGLSARNPSIDVPADLHSVADVSVLDPATGSWTALTPLPEPRSSHDAVVHDGKVYVVGGWTLAGNPQEGRWAKQMYVADLRESPLQWKTVDQPFERRALAAAAIDGQLVIVGGMDGDKEKPIGSVSIYDVAKDTWHDGPQLPIEGRMKGFGAAAVGWAGAVWCSASDGRVLKFEPGSSAWADTGHVLKHKRFFHRIVAHGDRLLFIGGADAKTHLTDIEVVDLSVLEAQPLRPASPEPPQTAAPPTAPATAPGTTDPQGSTTWPAFRGSGDSIARATALPLHWSDTTRIAFRTALPGTGQSSPVVWHDTAFVTSIDGENQQTLIATAIHLTDGSIRWTKTFPASQTVKTSNYVSKAAPTPIVDAHSLYLLFESGDVIALDHHGNLRWQRSLIADFGPIKGNHGLGSSPAHDDHRLFLLIDHDAPGYLLALDKQTGQTLWSKPRSPRVSWSSPILATIADQPRLLISSAGLVQVIDPATGDTLWQLDNLTGNTVPSPSVSGHTMVVGSTDRAMTMAIDLDPSAAGDRVLWKADKATCSFASPLLTHGSAFIVNKAGVAFRLELATGQQLWSLRLGESCWASPVAAGDHVLFFCKNGRTVVLDARSEQPTVIAENKIDIGSETLYGVAAVNHTWLLRTGSSLIAIR